MYKDKNKQRKAVREATRRYRVNKQGITPIVSQGITSRVSPMDRTVKPVIPAGKMRDTAVPTATTGHEPITAYELDRVAVKHYKIVKQSHTPMMVGYVPPEPDA